MKLNEMSKGTSGRITGFEKCDREYRQKLLRMGLVKGVTFTVVRKAPLGDPVEIETDSQKISLRAREAEVLLVEKN